MNAETTKWVIIGVLMIPVLRVLLWGVGIALLAGRDTYRMLRNAELKEGYGWHNWILVIPRCFYYRVKGQIWSWWHGIKSEIM